MNYTRTKNTLSKIVSSTVVATTLFMGTLGAFVPTIAIAAGPDVNVTIVKYIDGNMATSEIASSSAFQMSAMWNAVNIGAGTGQFALDADGFNGDPTPYQAVTSYMTNGSDYTTSEIMDDVVGANCAAGTPFSLVGYTSGNALEDAIAAPQTAVPPSFMGMTTDKYVIVWNHDCSIPEVLPETVTVTIDKFVQEAKATSNSANSAIFPMSATWDAANIGAGTGQYELGASSSNPYSAETVALTRGADYSTSEILTGDVVRASCVDEKPFALMGYTVGDTYAAAAAGTPTLTIPAFTNLQSDKYVIVWNIDCSIAGGGIGGDVEGPYGVLAVTAIDAVDTTATADGTFANGWKYVFHITAPTNEQDLAMKFSNWLRTGGGGTILVANNMRISSAQANNGGATILLTAADTYSTPALHMTGDLNPSLVGRQVQVTVDVAVPVGTVDGSYTSNYGVQTNP